LDMAFVASEDLSSDPRESPYGAVYHSNYDSYYWMTKFGDPGYLMSLTMGTSLTPYPPSYPPSPPLHIPAPLHLRFNYTPLTN